MRKKTTSTLMLTIIFSSFLSVAFFSRPALAEKSVSSKDFPYKSENKTVENLGHTTLNSEDKWNFFNGTNEWASLAYSDGNKTRLIVGVNGENSTSSLEKISAKYEAQIVNTVSINGTIRAVVVELQLRSVTAFVEEIHCVGLASYIEPNMKVQAQFVPNDPDWTLQWGPQKIEADWAWNTTVGNPSVLVLLLTQASTTLIPTLQQTMYPWATTGLMQIQTH